MTAKILISSANSYGNVGDDICGYSAEYLAKHYIPHAKTVVTQPPRKPELVEWADGVIIGGGGVIYDTDPQNVDNYMEYIEQAQKASKPTGIIGIGVQGITTDSGKKRYQSALSVADVLTTRTPVDTRLLNEAGVKGAITTQDLGFVADEWVKPPSIVDRIRLRRLFRGSGKPNLGLAFVDLVAIKGDAFDEKSKNFVDALENNLDQICDDFNVYLLVHSADDSAYYKRLKSRFNLTVVDYKTIKDFPFFWAAYQNLDLVIGSRFHSIILGCLAGKPVVGVSSESTKQNRLANYDMPTLKSQRLVFSDMEGVRDLFSGLRYNFDSGRYKPVTAQELASAKERAHMNGKLLKDAFEKNLD